MLTSSATVEAPLAAGLSGVEARARLAADGPNSVSTAGDARLRDVAASFWAPVPWLLEAAVVLQVVLHEYPQAGLVFGLLVLNALLGYLQSSKAQATLSALKARLATSASVRRDGTWAIVPAATLVRGDLMKISLGGVVAADARIVSGEVLLDRSMLTGESLPVEAGAGAQADAGALVERGEAIAEVTATGSRTTFGRTSELVRAAHAASTQQRAVLHVVRNLVAFNGIVAMGLLVYAFRLHLSTGVLVSLVLTAVLASIPVALPATFTLAAAVGARFLAAAGILPTRLSAVDEAASMDVLCCDKTGTLTLDELRITAIRPMAGFDEAHVLAFAALASDDGGRDPVDAAIRLAAAAEPGRLSDLPTLIEFAPFDPTTKMSSATVVPWMRKGTERVIKGAFAAVAALIPPNPYADSSAKEAQEKGYRVLAVALGPPGALQLAGLISLSDSPRPDSAQLVWELETLGVRTIMVTGDAETTAAIVAAAVGISGPMRTGSPVSDKLDPAGFAVYAGMLPEDKYRLVEAIEKSGHVVGMCGDGANDAAALRQAQMGIAVTGATDIAKAAAGIVLTTAGLGGIVTSVKVGRVAFQRILTYVLNAIVKKVVVVLLLVVGLVLTHQPVLTPMLMVVLMVVGDFLAMSLTTDNVTPSPRPNVWRVGNLTVAGTALGLAMLLFCSGVLAFGTSRLHLATHPLQTLAFLSVAFGTQATLYAIRERRHLRCRWPSRWLLASSLCDVTACGLLATYGVLMTPLPWPLVAGVLGAAVAFGLLLNVVKLPLFRVLKLS